MTDTRYARQTVLSHWDQNLLRRAHVIIVGAGALGGFISLGLAALGIGTLTLVDDSMIAADAASPVGVDRFRFLVGASAVSRRAATLALMLGAINPEVSVRSIPLRLRYDAMALSMPACHALIEASGDPVSQRICARYARQKGIPAFVGVAGASGGACAFVRDDENDIVVTAEGTPDIGVCEVIAGAMIEEVRKQLMPLPGDGAAVAGPFSYDLNQQTRFGTTTHPPSTPRLATSFGNVLIIGAGALGTYVALGLALSHGDSISRLTIVDPDIVEETNLNRQVLYHDAVGQPKAVVLARKLKLLQPGLNVMPDVGMVAAGHVEAADLSFLCVDNYAARAQVNQWAVKAGRPFINGGTSPFGGHVEVCAPGHTACLNCRLDVDRLAREQAGRRVRCGDAVEAGIVQTNMLIAGLMVCEAQLAHSAPLASAIEYDARAPARFGLRSARAACDCGQQLVDQKTAQQEMQNDHEPG